jgi:hypothetical protein
VQHSAGLQKIKSVKAEIVDNYFSDFFATLKSVSTFEALLEDQGKKSKKITGYCKVENVLLPLHSQFRKGIGNRKDSETGN